MGAGVSGLSVGYHLKKCGFEATLYEKDSKPGGLCKSIKYNSLVFDYGVHVSFSSNDYIKALLVKSVKGDYEEKIVTSSNYWKGYWIEHEPQNNLHSLPKKIIKYSLIDFINAYFDKQSDIKNYYDWCHKKFGNFFAENFTDVYTWKFWTIPPKELNIDWIGTRLHPPDLETVIDGALNIPRDQKHYIKTFRYPAKGGFESFIQEMKIDLQIKLNYFSNQIDLERKQILFNNGEIKSFDVLISTIPLPELIKYIKNVPDDVLDAVNCLRWTSLLMLNFYICRKIDTSNQWNYYYDLDIPYTRIFYMSRFAKENAPENCETLQVEIPYSKDKPLNVEKKDLIKMVIKCIHKTENIGLDEIKYMGEINIEYGYVIYDVARKKALEVIYKFLDKNDIYYCGRFAEWAYLWSDQAILSGKNVADRIKLKFKNKMSDTNE